jgi:small multidrug resistance pump
MSPIISLFLAIATEVVATTALKFSDGFSRPIPSAIVVIGYVASSYLLAITLKNGMAIGIAYAIWAGLGTALVVVLGVVIWRETLNLYQIAAIFMIVAGVVALNMASEGTQVAA